MMVSLLTHPSLFRWCNIRLLLSWQITRRTRISGNWSTITTSSCFPSSIQTVCSSFAKELRCHPLVLNSTGFVYTEHNRLWRKSRQPVKGSKCSGRDLNRNWPWMWGGNEGSSGEPCSEIYRGEQPADAPETQGLILKFAEINAKADLKLFIDWHSYSQLLLWRMYLLRSSR